jgi:CRP-like cAMP-binding protein
MEQYDYFRLFHNISQADYQLLTGKLKIKTFRKGDFIVSAGEIQKELYFVKSGVQMSYLETARKTHVMAFTYPPSLCAIPESFQFQVPSTHYLTSLTDSTVEYITYDELQRLFDASQPVERLFRRMTEAVLAGVINRHAELHSLTIEERFKVFCHCSPHLLQLVPQKYIASYLCIDPTNFSKLFNSVRL